jgi:hypothetical protein
MSNPETQNYPPSIKISRCFACNQELSSFKLLVCAECLDDDCDNFEKLTVSNKPIKKRNHE